ncbi:hypothetical protein N7462_001676 [Penicillium macrosclerotiorum]|uniref:uncharacterized protein n=1 Tax=Penicillium macrosclerotiorum TaxID=303699 RepID=UPI0025487A15|nr:uncharacterized protein N7462_001676 [Penicillium macrosclerotiorum]KAJ5692253.1 hypothetical protein N7462_001676 [Penicillium macrosclerotiorum]
MPPVQDTRQHASMQIPSSPSANSMIASRFYSSFQSGDSTSPSRPSSQHNRSKSQPLPGQQSMSSIAGSANGVSWSSRPLSDVNEAEERTSQAEQEGEPSSILSKSPEPEAPFQHDMQPQPHQEHDELNDKEDLVDGPAQYQINIYLDDAKSPIVHAQEQFSAPSPGFSLRSDKPHDPRADHSSTYHPTSEPSSPKSLHIDLSAHPHRSEARSLNETAEPVELALTKDDSSEEIIMSSTAYPGQEWTPMHY